MKRFLQFSSVTVQATLVSGLLFAQSHPAVGTWKLNLAKSKNTAAPLPKSGTRTVEAQGDGLKVNYDVVNADGASFSYGYTAKFDGKDNPITGSGKPNWRDEQLNGAETIALTRINTNEYESNLKKAGKVVLTVRIAVSKDGKVTTLTTKQPTTDVSVYDKQ